MPFREIAAVVRSVVSVRLLNAFRDNDRYQKGQDGPVTIEDSVTIQGDLTIPNVVRTGSVFEAFGSTAPAGTLECDGSSVSRTTYAALFAVIGTTFGGSGNSFNLPDYTPRDSTFIVVVKT